jgi:hypothetical protein
LCFSIGHVKFDNRHRLDTEQASADGAMQRIVENCENNLERLPGGEAMTVIRDDI